MFSFLPSATTIISNALAANGTNQAAQLYVKAGTPFSQLNTFEQWWAAWYLWIADPTIATGLMSFLMHEIVYFGRCIPWIIIDATPYFRKWKLQPDKIPSAQEQWECTKAVLFSHFTIELPAIWFFHPITELFGLSTWQVPLPSWKDMVPQVIFFFFFEDAFHYFAHQLLHYGPFYKHIHKLHHKYSAPFGLAAEYAHPVEVAILGTGTLAGPFLYVAIFKNLHIVSVYIWVILRLHQAIDAHSGYDFPWSLQHIFPLWSGADHHDFHHMAFVNNYSTSFRYLDYLFGTDNKYRVYKARLAAGDKEVKTEAWKKKVEAEVESEGIRAEAAAENGSWGREASASWWKSKAKTQ